MTSSRPYLVRAIYEWITDNGLTPYLLVDTVQPDTVVPMAYAENNKIVLNIGVAAVKGLQILNEAISFSARFDGKSMDVYVPSNAILAIYAKENGQGMMFNESDDIKPPPASPTSATKRPALKVVK